MLKQPKENSLTTEEEGSAFPATESDSTEDQMSNCGPDICKCRLMITSVISTKFLLAGHSQLCDFECIHFEAINRTGAEYPFFPTRSTYPNFFAAITLYNSNLLISLPLPASYYSSPIHVVSTFLSFSS